MKKSVLGVAAALLTYSFLPAHAAGWPEQKSVEVRVADIDLAKTTGMHTLYLRLRSAAREACSSVESINALVHSATYRSCVREAVDNAVATVDNPRFTAYVAQVRAPLMSRVASN